MPLEKLGKPWKVLEWQAIQRISMATLFNVFEASWTVARPSRHHFACKDLPRDFDKRVRSECNRSTIVEPYPDAITVNRTHVEQRRGGLLAGYDGDAGFVLGFGER
jgi:hypothetical protein